MPFNVKLNQLDWREALTVRELVSIPGITELIQIAWINSVTLSVRQWQYIYGCNLSLCIQENRKSFFSLSLSLSLSLCYSVLFISNFLFIQTVFNP